MSTPKRQRNIDNFHQKREIIGYAAKHPITHSSKCCFTSLLELPVQHKTVGDILSNKDLQQQRR